MHFSRSDTRTPLRNRSACACIIAHHLLESDSSRFGRNTQTDEWFSWERWREAQWCLCIRREHRLGLSRRVNVASFSLSLDILGLNFNTHCYSTQEGKRKRDPKFTAEFVKWKLRSRLSRHRGERATCNFPRESLSYVGTQGIIFPVSAG